MVRAYLQGQGREQEPGSARLDGPHQYRYPQKQGHQYHHHPVPPPLDDVHAPLPPPVCPAGAAPRREVAGAAEEAGGVATSAVGVDEDDPGARPLVISSRARSSRTCRKEGKGLWRVIHVFRWSKVLLRPHKTLSTKT